MTWIKVLGVAAGMGLAVAPVLTAQGSETPPIADNSFLMEEAYNQEAGVVQHISAFLRPTDGSSWSYSFTQEWPFFGQTSQLSYTVPVMRAAGTTGIGDVALNYRYQLVNRERVAVAPRLSVLLPTGSDQKGFGAGAAGVQVNLPLSLRVSSQLVTHWNAGATLTPSAKNALGDEATTTGFNLGASAIWLARPIFNVMVEVVWSRSEDVVGAGSTASSEQLLVVPGVRWAFNFASGLQIVPGVGFPLGVGPSRGDENVFLYLSFEHPLTRR